jgi:two-component system, NtrC family, response regulator HydG
MMIPEKSGKVLVIDDDKDVLFTAKLIMKGLFERVDTLERPGSIPEYLTSCKYDVIVLDMNFSRGSTSGKEGLEWIGRIFQIDPGVSIITTTAYGEISLAVQAMKFGAVDFLVKPWKKDQLIASIRNAVSLKATSRKNKNTKTGPEASSIEPPQQMISRSPVMANILDMIKMVAPTDANVLIMGENGTGKELTARALHMESLRNQKAFVHVDMSALPETLFESELFGHTRGAFTDAKEERAGRFEAASGGTLFLDEIGNLSLPLQAKILTAIQNREVIRLGSNHPVKVNVRLISATNKSLYQMADSFEFRQDLLYRINTIEIVLPPLRERKEDIPLLTDYYLKLFSEHYHKNGIRMKEETIQKLEEYHWPGNIRELAHTIERAVILCKSGVLTPEDFNLKKKPSLAWSLEEPSIRMEDYEKKAIGNILGKYNGNLSKAAGELGIARSTLYRKIAYFGIDN